ncbi:OB-fold nucleic acid binding domain-containing protein [Methanobrevibacter millerae]|uniref:OB-fold nucleic acid binding domain-containing protein n=1 Tax=Methanobrevibacter millerae TaxID=230361 RepID=A0A1G5XJ64_9EURY|nr:OB-fold nucleic acid binding domain-containing protein [Methanobrevibacter millerae]SDA70240.1 OB-fold nucleic acid binding domain-containing protein [Methanobrevibacter millerae]
MKITDDKLLKMALITSMIGLIGLILFTPLIEVKEVKIEDITRSMIDEEVSINCVVTDVKSSKSGSSYFLTINDGTGQMTLVIFESQVAQMQTNSFDIKDFKDKEVNVVGKITEYNNEMEIVLSSGNSLKIRAK